MATSGEARVRPPADRDVSAMVKPVPPTTAISRVSIDSMTASGGGRSRRLPRKSSIWPESPSTSMTAPELSLRTDPDRPSAAARA